MTRLVLWALVLVLAGCTTWTKPGATPAELDAAKSDCNAKAVAAAPPTLGPSPESGMSSLQAPAMACAPGRGCVTTGASTAPMAPPVTDVNAPARTAAFNQCMMDRGFSQ